MAMRPFALRRSLPFSSAVLRLRKRFPHSSTCGNAIRIPRFAATPRKPSRSSPTERTHLPGRSGSGLLSYPWFLVIVDPFPSTRSCPMKRLVCLIVSVAAGLVCGLYLKADETPASTADPAATSLLADARAARALYQNFPGFSADIEVNLDGRASRGHVEISDKGKAALTLDNAEAAKWAKNTLESIIAHRLSSGPDEETPCAFADTDEHHPLGRAIRVLNDEFHSSYRIRDRQVIVVNRHVPGARFTITVLKNIVTKENKFLPASYVVNTWDAKTDALRSSEAHHQTWQRIGSYDLPKETLSVKAAANKQESRSLQLSHIRLH